MRRRRPRTAAASRARASAGTRSRARRPHTTRCRSGNELLRRPVRPRDGRDAWHRQGDRTAVRRAWAARVALGYLRNDRAAEETAEELRNVGAEPVLVRGNVSSEKIVRQFAAEGPWDAIVHNAATGVVRTVFETEDKHWDWTLNANARALLSLARACATDMKPGSSIVGVSSLGSTRVLENYVLIGASKAALEAVVRYLAVELAPRGIRAH